MCGIAGGMTKTGQPPSDQVLTSMQTALRHRGPDDQGRFDSGAVSLVHTRLAIIDPDHGRQPFEMEDGTALVANGEIYNDLELHIALADAPYQTGSDNESALHAYQRFGLDFVKHLRGMYALALYDASKNRLILSRDPFGIKPLYYGEANDTFWFASEPQALTSAGALPRHENETATDQLLALQFTCADETAFKGIFRVGPGETLVIEEGRITQRFHTPPISSIDQASLRPVDEFDRLWLESVDLHRRSDVPYGVFFSGGVDSTAVLTAMTRLERRPVMTFTAGFGGVHVHDERDQASRLAKTMGADHYGIEIGAKDVWTHLPKIAAAVDDPVADYAVIPTFMLGREAAKAVKVVLTGEGGDEIFAGYGRYRTGRRPWPFRRRPWSRHVLASVDVLRSPALGWRGDIDATERTLAVQDLSQLQRLQALDIAHWLPNDLLLKVDRCLMAHSVEGRVPFLDGPLALFGFALADGDKVKGHLGKRTVRRWLAQHRPDSQPFSRKRGFSVPVGHWIAEQASRLAPLVARQPGVAAKCHPDAVESLFRRMTGKQAFAAWILLFYALWHQCHINTVAADGSVFDVLAEH